MNFQKYIYIVIASLIVLLLVGAGIWFFFLRSSPSAKTANSNGSLDIPSDNSNGVSNNTTPSNSTSQINTSGQVSQTKIFQITAGPVAGATLIQTLHPTTTLARYIKQEDGHVYDLPLDVAGAVPRVVSNVTIPGGARVVWVQGGNGAVMQYLDDNVVKSVYLGFPVSTTTASLPTRIQFLPDAIIDLAASPDGQSIGYLLKTSTGADGYITKPDGTNGKKVFSLPLSQLLLSWPSQGTLLAQTKSAAGVPGVVFSVNAKTGAVASLVAAQGITATANLSFSMLLYQISNDTKRTSYLHDIVTGLDAPLPISPSPEQCVWSSSSNIAVFCAAPVQSVPTNYLDLWHQGVAGSAEAIFELYTNIASENIVATPGGSDGGVQSDILEMALSPNEKYLLFTTKGDRSVWGVRLSQ